FRSGRPRTPEISCPLRDRLFALRLLRAVRRGLPGRRDPHGKGSAQPADARPNKTLAVPGRASQLEPEARRRQALSGEGRYQKHREGHRRHQQGERIVVIENTLLWLFAGTALAGAVLKLVLQ